MDFSNIDSRIVALGFARMADTVANSFLIVVLPLYIASGQITGWSFGLSKAAVTGVILGSFGIINSIIQPFAGRRGGFYHCGKCGYSLVNLAPKKAVANGGGIILSASLDLVQDRLQRGR